MIPVPAAVGPFSTAAIATVSVILVVIAWWLAAG